MAQVAPAYKEACLTAAALLERGQSPQQWCLAAAHTLDDGEALAQELAELAGEREGWNAKRIKREAQKLRWMGWDSYLQHHAQQLLQWDKERQQHVRHRGAGAAPQLLWLLREEQLDALHASVLLRLPPQVAAAVLEVLHPLTHCTLAQLMAAVQRPAVVRQLLQHLQQLTECVADTGDVGWRVARCMGTLLTEAANLGSAPLLDHFAALMLHALQQEQQLWAAGQQQAQQDQQDQQDQPAALAQWLRSGPDCDAARAPLLMAASSGNLEVLRLAVLAPAWHAATPSQRLLQAAYAGGSGPQQLLQVAAEHDQADALRLLIEDGGLQPTNELLVTAVRHISVHCVRVLLEYGPYEVPQPQDVLHIDPHSPTAAYTCPVLAALQERARKGCKPRKPVAGRLLLIMEMLQAAGCRPTVYENVQVQHTGRLSAQLVARFDPITDDPALDLEGANRWLWLAAQQTAWSTANHHRFLPRFKRAARALLLACHRHASGRGAVVSSRTAGTAHKQLGALPPDVVQHILGLAAHPLSAWAPGAKA